MNNFLSIVWYRVLPPEYGGQKGIAGFNEHLGRKVPLTCLCSRNNDPGTSLSYNVVNTLPVSRFQFWDPAVKNQILSFIKKQSFSHLIIEHPYHAWLGKYKEKMGFRFIVHAHNIEYLRMKVRGKKWWRLIKNTEQKAFKLADHILFKTAADQAAAVSIFNIDPAKCLLVPYGINETALPLVNTAMPVLLGQQYGIHFHEKIIVFAGTLDYTPNATALTIIVQHIIPLLRQRGFPFRLMICGALPPKKIAELNAIPDVTATGFVPSLQEYLQAADVFINPVTSGSGIQTKNIEAIASGCNVVATSFAATGLPDYLLHEKLFVSEDNDWEIFADNIVKASFAGGETPQQFYDEYNWQGIIDQLLPVITSHT